MVLKMSDLRIILNVHYYYPT